jgi:prolyl-tRNA synthetase
LPGETPKEKELVAVDQAVQYVCDLLDNIQQNLFERAKSFRASNTHYADTWDEFQKILEEKGGFIFCTLGWNF